MVKTKKLLKGFDKNYALAGNCRFILIRLVFKMSTPGHCLQKMLSANLAVQRYSYPQMSACFQNCIVERRRLPSCHLQQEQQKESQMPLRS
jgi:hypothetical protein